LFTIVFQKLLSTRIVKIPVSGVQDQGATPITGARWGLPGAEAILKLRAITSNGDFDRYWTWHLAQEQQRVHNSLYLASAIPR
jgi:hypothetical protein